VQSWIPLTQRRQISPLPGLELRSLGLLARNQSIYRLRSPPATHYVHRDLQNGSIKDRKILSLSDFQTSTERCLYTQATQLHSLIAFHNKVNAPKYHGFIWSRDAYIILLSEAFKLMGAYKTRLPRYFQRMQNFFDVSVFASNGPKYKITHLLKWRELTSLLVQ
jgi:hypothetical protein